MAHCAKILILLILLASGCASTSSSETNRGVAPPLPTPNPAAPGQMPPPPGAVIQPPPGMGVQPPPGVMPQTMAPQSPEQVRVQQTAQRLYQANPWLRVRPQWYVTAGDTPGVNTQGEQYAMVSSGLVQSASDGQLAAVMALQLGDLMAARQRVALQSVQNRRETSPPPDIYQEREGMTSSQALLDLAAQAKFRGDPRDPRRREQQQQIPMNDAPTCARQILVQAGYSEYELDQAAPLLQRFPMVRPAP